MCGLKAGPGAAVKFMGQIRRSSHSPTKFTLSYEVHTRNAGARMRPGACESARGRAHAAEVAGTRTLMSAEVAEGGTTPAEGRWESPSLQAPAMNIVSSFPRTREIQFHPRCRLDSRVRGNDF